MYMCMHMYMYTRIYSTSQKKLVPYAPGAFLERSRFALGTLEFGGACGVVQCGWCGTVRLLSAVCACAIMCALRFHARGW